MGASLRLNNTKKFLKSKFLVASAIIMLCCGMFFVAKPANADDNSVDFSIVYQYYLLSSKASDEDNTSTGIQKLFRSVKNAVVGGPIGNGAITSNITYADMVQSSPNKPEARRFVRAMVTLTSYNYLQTTSYGIISIYTIPGRVLTGLILLLFGIILDIISGLYTNFLTTIVKYNIFLAIGNAFVKTKMASGLQDALGLDEGTVKSMVSLGLSVLMIVLLGTLIWALRRGGSNIDQTQMSKLKGRFVGLVMIPVAMASGAMMLAEFSGISVDDLKEKPAYADYLLDTKSWAFKNNFSLKQIGAQDFSTGKDGTYLDTSYNPYKVNGKRASLSKAIYDISDYQSTKTFKNTALALGYLSRDTYNAWDYLNFQMSSASSGTDGSIYDIAKDYTKDNLINFTDSYSSRGTRMEGWDKMEDKDSKPMVKAKEDYVADKKRVVAPKITIWTDRYIYGAKTKGAKYSDYYKATPSIEQVFSGAGGNSGRDFRLSDESMFYALSTKFEDNGGKIYISKPSKGAFSLISNFDSDRPLYFSVSMVGNPFYTLPALLSKPLISITVFIASLVAFLSIGILDMNLKPFRAWLKAITMGDIEYTMATFVYAIGITATIVMFALAPKWMVDLLDAVATTVMSGLTNAKEGNTVITSELIGLGNFFTFLVSITMFILYIKNAKFRQRLTEILMIPWAWADAKGQMLEESVSSKELEKGRSAMKTRMETQAQKQTQRARNSAMGNTAYQRAMNKVAEGDTFAQKGLDKLANGNTSFSTLARLGSKGIKKTGQAGSKLAQTTGQARLAGKAIAGTYGGDNKGDKYGSKMQYDLREIANMKHMDEISQQASKLVDNLDDNQLADKLLANEGWDASDEVIYDSVDNKDGDLNATAPNLDVKDVKKREYLNDLRENLDDQVDEIADDDNNITHQNKLNEMVKQTAVKSNEVNAMPENDLERRHKQALALLRNNSLKEEAINNRKEELGDRKAILSDDNRRGIKHQMNEMLNEKKTGLNQEETKALRNNLRTISELEAKDFKPSEKREFNKAQRTLNGAKNNFNMSQKEINDLSRIKRDMKLMDDNPEIKNDKVYQDLNTQLNSIKARHKLSDDDDDLIARSNDTINVLKSRTLTPSEQKEYGIATRDLTQAEQKFSLTQQDVDELSKLKTDLQRMDMHPETKDPKVYSQLNQRLGEIKSEHKMTDSQVDTVVDNHNKVKSLSTRGLTQADRNKLEQAKAKVNALANKSKLTNADMLDLKSSQAKLIKSKEASQYQKALGNNQETKKILTSTAKLTNNQHKLKQGKLTPKEYDTQVDGIIKEADNRQKVLATNFAKNKQQANRIYDKKKEVQSVQKAYVSGFKQQVAQAKPSAIKQAQGIKHDLAETLQAKTAVYTQDPRNSNAINLAKSFKELDKTLDGYGLTAKDTKINLGKGNENFSDVADQLIEGIPVNERGRGEFRVSGLDVTGDGHPDDFTITRE